MSSLPKRRRVKRPTIVAKRSQLAKNDLFKKRSYKPLYEKLKANNNALAKALSKEKQHYQHLFAEKLGLTSEVHELKVACNIRDDVISNALKNATDTLQLLITMSNHVTNTIASCQQFATTTRYTPRRLSTNDRRESSTGRLSGKSPARGVVQPMVSGHTITKPTINLSRVNIQSQCRVQRHPNLSDIEESLTQEASPVAPARTSPVRISITRPLNYGTTRVNRLPERLRNSMRASDESERRLSVSSNRNSGRRSARRSRKNSGGPASPTPSPPASPRSSQASADAQTGEFLQSPRVALHDVSRLLHNSQSVNIRTLMKNSSDIDATQAQQISAVSMSDESPEIASRETIPESPENPAADSNVTNLSFETSNLHNSNGKSQNSFIDTEDPLEGPSWLLNSPQSASPSPESEISTTMNNSALVLDAKDRSKNNRTYDRDESQRTSSESEAPFVNFKSRGQSQSEKIIDEDNDEGDENDDAAADEFFNKLINVTGSGDDDGTSNIGRFITRKRGSECDDREFTLMIDSEKRKKKYSFDFNDLQLPVLESPIAPPVQATIPEPEHTTNIQRITMTQHLGNLTLDSTTSYRRETVFDHTGLILPMIEENPGSARPSRVFELDSDEEGIRSDKRKRKRVYKTSISSPDLPSDSEVTPTPKPELARPTTTVVEQEHDKGVERSDKRKRKRVYKTLISSLDLPSDSEVIPTPKPELALSTTTVVEQEHDGGGVERNDKTKRKRVDKKRVNPPDSSSDTEWVPTPKRKNIKPKHKPSRAKDPSSAKVVLLKLNDTCVKKRSPSPEPRISLESPSRRSKSMQRDVLSDSDGSRIASPTSKNVPSRPRRQKAPTNLQEPSLGKKMRRT